MEPMLLKPEGKDYLWGGTRLRTEYNKQINLTPLAETWECSVHPDGPSLVTNGEFAGMTLDKVLALKKYVSERGLDIDIEVDGGIKPENIGLVTSAGANIIVAGSAIFKAKKPRAVMQEMKEAAAQNPYKG